MSDSASFISTGSEHRRSSRFDDRVSLYVSAIDTGSMDDAIDGFETRRARFLLANNLQQVTKRTSAALKDLAVRDRDVHAVLEVLNYKIDLVALALTDGQPRLPEVATHEVNVSAHGIRFPSRVEYAPGTLVEMGIRLFPDAMGIFVQGEVTRCEEAEPGNHTLWRVAINFTLMHEDDRNLLSRHLFELDKSRSRVAVDLETDRADPL
ncbi:MAG: PilZ domain-containing protein [Gammaproteobacteria bacterium]|jgi:hypothetical protein|nr:PilZ domain-containing protein [Gammaproteobacteria bacterium]